MSTKQPDVAKWAAEEVAALTPASAKGISEAEIAEKVAAGLSREQAIEVIHQQTLSDAKSGAGKPKTAKAK